ncbi:TorF family putative porin [Sphingomonas sp. PAMC 26605]|uniref:TorF family putative porin n=1 Tax=Sphingomonas sp. PAMC 26605 TaxID=1112214 RepID=UPI00026CB58A|nr:TorF family putative porin [Sphingomonas sp. PAMC 26605]
MAIALLIPTVARAEPGYSLTLASDDRFRGHSTSDGLPVATAAISYDDVSGVYGGLSVTLGPTRNDGLQPLRSVQHVGYAHRLRSGLALDAGVTNRFYSRYATVEYGGRFTQAYLGVVGRRFSTHIYYSPNYDGHARSATYVELDGLLFDRGAWSLASHVGALAPPQREGRPLKRVEIDGRLGLSRQIGKATVSATLVGGGPDEDGGRWRGTMVLAINRSF